MEDTLNSVLSLPLTIDQATLAEEVDLRATLASEQYDYNLPPHLEEHFYRQSVRVNGRNACAFLTLMVLGFLLVSEQVCDSRLVHCKAKPPPPPPSLKYVSGAPGIVTRH